MKIKLGDYVKFRTNDGTIMSGTVVNTTPDSIIIALPYMHEFAFRLCDIDFEIGNSAELRSKLIKKFNNKKVGWEITEEQII